MNARLMIILLLFGSVLCGADWRGARAESYPTRPIRLLVPYPAGGGADFMARLVAPALSERLGQQVFVNNRDGAGGTIGTTMVARAPADG